MARVLAACSAGLQPALAARELLPRSVSAGSRGYQGVTPPLGVRARQSCGLAFHRGLVQSWPCGQRSQEGGGHIPTKPHAAGHPASRRVSAEPVSRPEQSTGQSGAGRGAGIPHTRALPSGYGHPDLGTLDSKQTTVSVGMRGPVNPWGQRNLDSPVAIPFNWAIWKILGHWTPGCLAPVPSRETVPHLAQPHGACTDRRDVGSWSCPSHPALSVCPLLSQLPGAARRPLHGPGFPTGWLCTHYLRTPFQRTGIAFSAQGQGRASFGSKAMM